jgi:uncharacterized SAM-binding protein YcdF (DUF218 family)
MSIEYRIFFKVLLLPPSLSLLIGLAGLALFVVRRWRAGAILCAVSIGSLWVLATPVVSDALSRATEAYPPLDPTHLDAQAAQAQAIVVLGGGVRRGAPEVGADAPGLHADLRLIEAAKIARATQLPVLISGSPREAAAMRRFMQEDLSQPVRWVEGASTTTHENALFSARLLAREHINRIILVTSSMHLKRATAEFRAAGFEVTPAPAEMWTHDERYGLGFVPSVGALERSHTALYEWLGRLVQRL